ncbi:MULTISPECIES: hypothetical protein [unclassified Agarivorans]|uniref:hypothetical protein n=1 Tax=unclassified Agarivorans TaxID=2636026 RepID=UPI003D7E49C0
MLQTLLWILIPLFLLLSVFSGELMRLIFESLAFLSLLLILASKLKAKDEKASHES